MCCSKNSSCDHDVDDDKDDDDNDDEDNAEATIATSVKDARENCHFLPSL
jgi:hypothetical protein